MSSHSVTVYGGEWAGYCTFRVPDEEPKCPKCGSDDWQDERVDVGWGEKHGVPVGPYHCYACGHTDGDDELGIVERNIPFDR